MLKHLWRFSKLFVSFVDTNVYGNLFFFFRYLKIKNINLFLVIDIIYHSRTLHFLHRFTYFTLGPVPMTQSCYSLSVSLPVSSNSVISNLFFMRLILKLKSLTSETFFNKQKLLLK